MRTYYIPRNEINPAYLECRVNTYIKCAYCGRILLFQDMILHERKFHRSATGDWLLD